MKTTANVKRVHENGETLNFYRFKIEYKDHKGDDKVFIRWESSAENAILKLIKQYGWTLVQYSSPVMQDDYCKALVRVWVPNAKQTGIKFANSEGSNFTYWVEAYQSDN